MKKIIKVIIFLFFIIISIMLNPAKISAQKTFSDAFLLKEVRFSVNSDKEADQYALQSTEKEQTIVSWNTDKSDKLLFISPHKLKMITDTYNYYLYVKVSDRYNVDNVTWPKIVNYNNQQTGNIEIVSKSYDKTEYVVELKAKKDGKCFIEIDPEGGVSSGISGKFLIEIDVENLADKAEKTLEMYTGYIQDKDSKKLEKEDGITDGAYYRSTHIFGSPKNKESAKSAAYNFIKSYKFISMNKITKIDGYNVPKNLVFKNFEYNKNEVKGVYIASTFFIFKATGNATVYKNSTKPSGTGEFTPTTKWVGDDIKIDNEYSVYFRFIYNSNKKSMLYCVSYEYYDKNLDKPRNSGAEKALEDQEDQALSNDKDFVKALKLVNDFTNEERKENETYEDVLKNTDYYSDVGDIKSEDAKKVETAVGKILGIITNIGIIVSLLIPAILGVKYMIGSVEEKAEYKKDMIPYLVGAVMLFGISTVLKIIQSVGQDINKI